MPKPKQFKNEKRITVKVEKSLHQAAHKKAQEKGITLSELVRRLLFFWLTDQQ